MNKRTFGKTGLEVSVLGFGAAPIGYLDTAQQDIDRILNLLLDHGVNLIDTAACYPGSEEAVGKAVSARRDEYVLVTKCGHKVEGADGDEWTPKLITNTVERALRQLRTDHLDVLLLHSCKQEVLERGDALGAILKARDAGKVRFAGYSGDNEAAAYAAALPDVAVLETSVSLADQANIDLALPVARKHNVGVLAKRPVANTAWINPEEQAGIYVNYSEGYRSRLKAMQLSPSSLGMPDDNRGSWMELALRFTAAQEGVHTLIVGTTNPEHAKTNIATANKPPLPADVVAKIRAAFADAERKSGEKWLALS